MKKFFVELLFRSGLALPIWWFIFVMLVSAITKDGEFAGFGGRVFVILMLFAIPLQIAMEKKIKFLLMPLALGASIINAIYQDITALQIVVITFVVCLILSIIAKKTTGKNNTKSK
jgi:hypothetical protein